MDVMYGNNRMADEGLIFGPNKTVGNVVDFYTGVLLFFTYLCLFTHSISQDIKQPKVAFLFPGQGYNLYITFFLFFPSFFISALLLILFIHFRRTNSGNG